MASKKAFGVGRSWRVWSHPAQYVAVSARREDLGRKLTANQAALRVHRWFAADRNRDLLVELCAEIGRHTRERLGSLSTEELCRELADALRRGKRLFAYTEPRSTSAAPIMRTAVETDAVERSRAPQREVAELTWIEIELVDEADKPVPGALYRLELSDGEIRRGRLNREGWAREDRLVPGKCEVTFPDLDQEAWSYIKALPEKSKAG